MKLVNLLCQIYHFCSLSPVLEQTKTFSVSVLSHKIISNIYTLAHLTKLSRPKRVGISIKY